MASAAVGTGIPWVLCRACAVGQESFLLKRKVSRSSLGNSHLWRLMDPLWPEADSC